jgi:hypothetical protein
MIQPNEEQSAIIQAVAQGHQEIAVNALAGTGKTTTVGFLVHGPLRGRSVQYLVFNKKNADEAKLKLPGIQVNTAHSLAYNGTHPEAGRSMKQVYGSSNRDDPNARLVGSLFGKLRQWARNENEVQRHLREMRDFSLSASQCFYVMMDVLKHWTQSDASRALPGHLSDDLMEKIAMKQTNLRIPPQEELALREAAAKVTNVVIRHMIDPSGGCPVDHDFYLKLWSMSNPQLPVDHVLFDEAQDASPAMLNVVLAQKNSQILMVGDTHQSIYGWRGAVDAMKILGKRPDAITLPLTASYRFGQAVADAGNVFLEALGSNVFLKGLGAPSTVINTSGQFDAGPINAVLFRSNGRLIEAALTGLANGDNVHMAGDQSKELQSFLDQAGRLYRGERIWHPELQFFDHFDDLKQYSESPFGNSWKFMVKMVAGNHGNVQREVELLDKCAHERNAQYTLSTAHRSKGLEFDGVVLGDDLQAAFQKKACESKGENNEPMHFSDIRAEELRLIYVAATRARRTLYTQDLFTALGAVKGVPEAVRNRMEDLLETPHGIPVEIALVAPEIAAPIYTPALVPGATTAASLALPSATLPGATLAGCNPLPGATPWPVQAIPMAPPPEPPIYGISYTQAAGQANQFAAGPFTHIEHALLYAFRLNVPQSFIFETGNNRAPQLIAGPECMHIPAEAFQRALATFQQEQRPTPAPVSVQQEHVASPVPAPKATPVAMAPMQEAHYEPAQSAQSAAEKDRQDGWYPMGQYPTTHNPNPKPSTPVAASGPGFSR